MRRSPKSGYLSKRHAPLAEPIRSATSTSERRRAGASVAMKGLSTPYVTRRGLALAYRFLHETYQRKGLKGRLIKKVRHFIPHYFIFC